MGAVIALLEERRISLRPSQGKYPDAVGLDKARDHVIRLLNLQDQSTRKIIVVYGVGGIGKTTLASAVFKTLDLTGYKHCRVFMKQECSASDIQSLQEQILQDLFKKKIGLRSYKEGQEQLSEAFREEPTRPLFMFIDNALRGSDLAMLLPEDLSCLPGQSRILITTRRLDETNIVLHPHIQRCPYPLEPLPSLEAKKLLCKKVLGSVDASFDTDIDIYGLVECCGGIPLVLELVASNLLSDGSKVSHWVNFLKETRQQVEEELTEQVVDCVYNTCLSMRLNNLKRLAVCHGKRLSMNNDDCKTAESLRVLKLKYSSTLPDSLGDLSLLKELKLDKCTFVSLPHSLGQLKSLRHLSLGRCPDLTILPDSLGNLSSLEKLYLDTCRKLEGLPESVSQLSSLRELSIRFCEKLSRLPNKFGELESLKYLNVEHCRSLKNLSEDFGSLISLAAMKAKGCSELEEKAMDTLVELKSLMFLNIEESPMLMARWEQIKENHPLVVYSTPESWGRIWQKQFRKMMSWEFSHLARRLMQLDGGGNLVEWIPSSSLLDGQAKVGLLFTTCDLCAPSNNEGSQTVREKCTELRGQGFDIVYVEVVGLGELSQQREEDMDDHIRQALLSLSPRTIACIAPHKNMSQLFAYYAYKAGKDVELTLVLDALNTFVVEVKPRDSQQSEHSLDDSERFRRLFSPLEDLRLTVMSD